MSRLKLRIFGKGTPTPTPTPSVTYDTTMGSSVDANGFTTLPLRPTTAVRYFVGSGGNDSNTGLSHAQRFATLAKAVSLVAAGNGDQVLIAEGTTLAETLPKGGDPHSWVAAFPGFSATYPTVWSSYDPADPTNEAKIGMGHQRSARPKLTALMGQAGGGGSYIAIKGLDFDTGSAANQAWNFVGAINYLLIENCIFRYNGVSISDGGDGISAPTLSHIIIRNCSSYGVWTDTNGNVGNIYVQSVDGFTYEDNVNYHSGWRIGASRDDTPASAANGGSGLGGGPTVFKHPIYIQANCNNIIVHRNLFMDGSADAGISRGDNAVWQYNVSLRCPAGTGIGPGNSAEFGAYPGGVHVDVSYNLSMEGIDLNSTNQSGYGYTLENIASGSRVHHNILLESSATKPGNANAIATTGGAAFGLPTRPTWTQYEYNVSKNWNSSGTTKIESSTPITSNYDHNIWDDPASGTNINWSAATFPNAYTPSALYAAAGVTDYATLATLAINAPEQHYQRTILALAQAGYGIS